MKISTEKILFKSALKDLKKNAAQIAAIIFISAIASTLFTGFLANTSSLTRRVDYVLEKGNVADIYVTTDPRVVSDSDDFSLIKNIVGNNGVVEKRFYAYCNLNSQNSMAVISENIPSLSCPYKILEKTDEHSDDHFFMIDSTLKDNEMSLMGLNNLGAGSEAEVSLDVSSYLDGINMSLLDIFLKSGADNPLKSGKLELKFTVSAVIEYPENIAKVSSYVPMAFLCSSRYLRDVLRDTLSDYFTDSGMNIIWSVLKSYGWGDGDLYGDTENFPKANQFLVKLNSASDTEREISAIKTAFSNKEVDNLYSVTARDDLDVISPLKTEITQSRQITWVFPIVFYFVALLVVITSARQSLLRQRTEIGVFKALGIKNRDLFRHYMFETGIVVFIGAALGLIAGPFIVPYILNIKYSLLYTLPARRYTFPYLFGGLALIVFVGISLAVSYLVLRREMKLKPVESMRPPVPKEMTANVKNKTDVSFLKISAKMTLRNIVGDKVKTVMVVIGVLGCTMLLCCGFGIEDTINYGISTDTFIQSGADVTVVFTENKTESQFLNDFSSNGGSSLLAGYQPYYSEETDVFAGSRSYYVKVKAIGEYRSLGGEKKEHFARYFPSDTALVSAKTAQKLKIKKGDTIRFSIDKKEITVKVYDVFEAFYDNGVFIHANSELLTSPISEYSAMWLDASENDVGTVKAAAQKIQYVGAADLKEEWEERISNTVSSVMTITMAIRVFAILLAAVVLYNLALLNFKERIRQIATLKVMGFKRFEISMPILAETLSLTLIGVIFGLIAGFPFTKFVLYINSFDTIYYTYKIYASSYFMSFLLTFVLAFILNILLAFSVGKVKAIESLKSVE